MTGASVDWLHDVNLDTLAFTAHLKTLEAVRCSQFHTFFYISIYKYSFQIEIWPLRLR